VKVRSNASWLPPGKTLGTTKLLLADVSLLHRHALLARLLKLSIDELLVLIRLSGLEPFRPHHRGHLTQLDQDHPFTQTLAFVELVSEVRASGIDVATVDFLMRHRFDEAGELRPDRDGQRALLRTLAQGVRAIRAEHALPADGAAFTNEEMRRKLGLALPSPVADALLAMLAGTQAPEQAFFDTHLLKSAPDVVPAKGFLEAADFALLFDAAPAGETDAERATRQALQRLRLAQAFLPQLQRRLERQFVVQTVAAAVGADAALVEALLTQPTLLANPGALLTALAAAGDPEPTVTRPAADTLRIEGWFEVPAAGAWRFLVKLANAGAKAELRLPERAQPLLVSGTAAVADSTLGTGADQFVTLAAGVLIPFSFEATVLGGGTAELWVQGEGQPPAPLTSLTLYSSALAGAEQALQRLAKAMRLLQGLRLDEREASWLLGHRAEFGGVNLSELPLERSGDDAAAIATARQRFAGWRRLAAYARLRDTMVGGGNTLIGVFEAQALASPTRLADHVYPAIARVTRRAPEVVQAAAEALLPAATSAGPAIPPAFASEQPLARLWDALLLSERLGVAPATVADWCALRASASTGATRRGVALNLRDTLKARFDAEAWRRVAQPINDRLRQSRRDALVAALLHRLGYDRLEQLYEHFLIDPGMEPVVQTSRIRLGIASVQLFIQRCLLNLEPEVHPSTIVSDQWEWMKRYRVWEANRKIFLFPENWLEPEFRDDKTNLFTELEGTLLQGDVSASGVEDAFLAYLKKFDAMARLDIVAMHAEDNADPARRQLHVFGRTYGEPHQYFYRRYAKEAWTPWEPVDAPIEGDHLAPVVWRGRLFLFWVTFLEKAKDNAAPSSSNDPDLASAKLSAVVAGLNTMVGPKRVEVHLHWSECVQGEWSTCESASAAPVVVADVAADFSAKKVLVHVSRLPGEGDGEEGPVLIHLNRGGLDVALQLAGRNSAPEAGTHEAAPEFPLGKPTTTSSGNRYRDNATLTVRYRETIINEIGTTTAAPVEKIDKVVLGNIGPFSALPCNSKLVLGVTAEAFAGALDTKQVEAVVKAGIDEIASLSLPFFVQDNRHTFFVQPEVAETTVDEEIGYPIVEIPPKFDRFDDWEILPVSPFRPKIPLPIPTDYDPPFWWPGSPLVDPPRGDWLINDVTVIKVGDQLIGPRGQPGIEIVKGGVLGDLVTIGNVGVGTAISGGKGVVVRDDRTLGESQLDMRHGELKVVDERGIDFEVERRFEDVLRGASGGFGGVGVGRLGG
jgi:hypothetical protein